MRRLINILWACVCFVYDETTDTMRAIIRGQIIIMAIMFALFFLGQWTGSTWLVVFSLIFTSLILVLYVLTTEVLIRIISAVANFPIVNRIGDETKAILEKLLRPLLASAMTIAWLSAITAIRGIGYYGFSDFIVWGPIILFACIFTAYSGIKTKFFEYSLVGLLVFTLVSYHLFPIQVLGVLGWLEAKTIRRSVIASQDAKQDDLVVITPGTPLYKFSHGNFKKIAKAEEKQEAKVVGRKNDPKSKEGLFEVILPDKDTPGLYIGGDTFFVPARMAVAKILPMLKKPSPTPSVRSRNSFESMSFGEHDIILAPGEKTAWLRLPDNCSWDLFETVRAGKWGVTPYGGKTFRFEPGQSRYAYLTDQDTIIMAENFGTEPLPLRLIVRERRKES